MRRLMLLLAAGALAAGVQAGTGFAASVSGSVSATPISTCNGAGLVTVTLGGAGPAANIAYLVTARPGFSVVPAGASDGYFTASVNGFQWNLPGYAAAPVTVTYQVMHTALLDGVQTFQFASLTGADATGNFSQSLDNSTVSVTGCNKPPVSRAGSNQTVIASGSPLAPVQLNGGGSTDDGQLSALTYTWKENGITIGTGVSPVVNLPVGQHTILLTVFDGQYSDVSSVIVVVLDTTPPVVTPVITGTIGANGWYITDVTIAWTVVDPESPTTVIKQANCTPVTLTTDTPGMDFSCTASSAGGGITVTTRVKRDATKPTVIFTGNLGTYTVDQKVVIGCSASDATSGLANSTCPTVNAPAYTFPLGLNTITATATDNAGNTTTVIATFTVKVTYASLCNLAKEFAGSEIGKSLCDALCEAEKWEKKGDLKKKAAAIADFQKIVTKNSPKCIPADKAAILINLSKAL